MKQSLATNFIYHWGGRSGGGVIFHIYIFNVNSDSVKWVHGLGVVNDVCAEQPVT